MDDGLQDLTARKTLPDVRFTSGQCCGFVVPVNLLTASCASVSAPEEREISTADLRDKIAGGWAGQMIGVAYGWPTEFRHNDRLVPLDEMPQWTRFGTCLWTQLLLSTSSDTTTDP